MPSSSARDKLRGSVESLLRRSQETVSTESNPVDYHHKRQGSKSTTNSSPVDATYDPKTRTLRTVDTMTANTSNEITPANAEAMSDSSVGRSSNNMYNPPSIAVTGPEEPKSFFNIDSSSDEDEPVIHRVSSVRVSKPQIVKHAYKAHGYVPQIHTEHPIANERPGGPADALQALEGNKSRYPKPHHIPGGPADALRALEANAGHHTSTSTAPSTPEMSSTSSQSVVDDQLSNASTKIESLDVSPQPMIGFKNQQPMDSLHRTNSTTPSINGLRLNPMTEVEKVRLSRTVSAPVAPNRNPNRRVRIRTSDLVINHPEHDHNLFRESVVTTPYPGRNSSTGIPEIHELKAFTKIPKTLSSTPEHAIATPEKDRFPSPKRAELFFLVLALAAHPEVSITVEFHMSDPHPAARPFDDELLFQQLRQAYHTRLLGITRRLFSSRILSYASLSSPTGLTDLKNPFDSASFIAHLHNPAHGRKRKTWILWLCQHQPNLRDARSSLRSNSVQPSPNSMQHPWNSPTTTPASTTPTSTHNGNKTPQVNLHYTSHPGTILFTTTLLITLSAISTILWVLFGVPGLKAGDSRVYPNNAVPANVGLMDAEYGWKKDAELRVLTGLVLGVFVFLIGGLGAGAWILGGWVLL